jgi:hypothetical protein
MPVPIDGHPQKSEGQSSSNSAKTGEYAQKSKRPHHTILHNYCTGAARTLAV